MMPSTARTTGAGCTPRKLVSIVIRSLSTSASSCSPLTVCSPARLLRTPLTSQPRRSFGHHPRPVRDPILPSSLVTAEWLADNLSRVKILDGSWHMPSDNRNSHKDFLSLHIPPAHFFDLDRISDHSTPLPHMLPSVDDFAREAGQLGIQSDDPIVIYDTKGVFSAARVWFTFRCFGARDVAVLQGGLPHWLHLRLPTSSSPPLTPSPASFIPHDHRRTLVKAYPEMLTNTSSPHPFQVLDARSAGRFSGREVEPRAGLSSGHMPRAVNVPYGQLVEKEEGGGVRLKDVDRLMQVMKAAGVKLNDSNAPIVTTCGTGVTASVIALALEQLGHRNWSVYDGSWTEWAQQKGAPIVKSE